MKSKILFQYDSVKQTANVTFNKKKYSFVGASANAIFYRLKSEIMAHDAIIKQFAK